MIKLWCLLKHKIDLFTLTVNTLQRKTVPRKPNYNGTKGWIGSAVIQPREIGVVFSGALSQLREQPYKFTDLIWRGESFISPLSIGGHNGCWNGLFALPLLMTTCGLPRAFLPPLVTYDDRTSPARRELCGTFSNLSFSLIVLNLSWHHGTTLVDYCLLNFGWILFCYIFFYLHWWLISL